MAFLQKSIKITKYNISKEDRRVNWLKCYDKIKDEDVSQKKIIDHKLYLVSKIQRRVDSFKEEGARDLSFYVELFQLLFINLSTC